MNAQRPSALVADDEPLLRDALVRALAQAWPQLEVRIQARNGREAVEGFDAQPVDVCFLDVHMPGLSGIEAARHIGRRAHLVFVTAFDHYAVQAFAQGAIDYLVKPVEPQRLAETCERLRERLASARPAPEVDALLTLLAQRLGRGAEPERMRYLRASAGSATRLIPVEAIDYLRADEKYTRIAWHDEGRPAESVVRTPLKDLLPQLDPALFAQVHRSVVVALRAVAEVQRGDHDNATIRLRGRDETLPVSRSYLHLFRQM